MSLWVDIDWFSAKSHLSSKYSLKNVITFGIDKQTIAEGKKANLSLFNPEGKSIFTKENILSKSKNSAFLGVEIKGKVYGIYNQGKLVLG